MPNLSYLKAINRALNDELARDPAVFVMGEDVRKAVTNVTAGLFDRYGPARVLETPLSEQGFTNFATGAALAGRRPVIEFAIPFLLVLTFEQIAGQAARIGVMSGGQGRVPVTYLVSTSGERTGWGGQHSDQPYSLVAHAGVKTAIPATPTDAYGLLVTAIRDDDPVVMFCPRAVLDVREDVVFADLGPVPLGVGRVHRPGSDVTVVAVGHLVHEALAVADELAAAGIEIEVFDPRTVYPFDWDGLAQSLERTGRLVVIDDTNRTCGMAAEIVATAAEEMRLIAPPRRVTRPDGAVVGCSPALDPALLPNRAQLAEAVRRVMAHDGRVGGYAALAPISVR
jgi:acetoin:2,6-dichlorophenolindophenol oxidoreductase subunit beta